MINGGGGVSEILGVVFPKFRSHAVLFFLPFALVMLTAALAFIYFVFLPAAPSSCSGELRSLPVCFVRLFVWPFSTVPGFQPCAFVSAPADLLSLPYPPYGPLLFSYL